MAKERIKEEANMRRGCLKILQAIFEHFYLPNSESVTINNQLHFLLFEYLPTFSFKSLLVTNVDSFS